MKCFYHRDRDAIGNCKSCGKGLCDDCQTDLGRGLACKNRCEENVRGLISLIEHNVRAAPAAKVLLRLNRPVWVGVGVFVFLPGGFFAALGALDDRFRILIPLGAMLCVFGLLAVVFALRLPRIPERQLGPEQSDTADRPRE
jgi:hypothetical protein